MKEEEGTGMGCIRVCVDGCRGCNYVCGLGAGSEALNDMWCRNAEENGPPVWWLSLRPNGNANQFCTEVGMTLGRPDS
jgi:hypothetical protein